MTTDQRVYQLMKQKADPDGFVNAAAGNLAIELQKPERTIQGALQRLEKANQIFFIKRGQFVVVELAQP